MPSGKNWVNFLYVNIAFAIYIAGVFYYSQLAEIKANWPLYRCNPMYMLLADDIEENFTIVFNQCKPILLDTCYSLLHLSQVL